MKLPEEVIDIHKKFTERGYDLFCVGGCVRDFILNQPYSDIDLVTNAYPDEIEKILEGYRFDLTGRSFGVLRVYTKDNPKGYEVATYREDGPGRKPQVKIGSSILSDAKRRDFTINSLYYDISKGEVIDILGGVSDVKNGIIRTCGNPADRFMEDKLRVLRCVRFSARFGFDINDETRKSILNDNKLEGPDESGTIIPISQERIAEEFLKGLEQALSVEHYINLLEEFGLLEQIFVVPVKKPIIFSRIPEIMIANLLNPDKLLLSYFLVQQSKFSIKISEGVKFIHELENLSPDNVLTLHKQMQKTNITMDQILEYTEIKNNIIKAFAKYSITTDGNDLIKEGFVGKAIGDELERREKEIFKNLLKTIQ